LLPIDLRFKCGGTKPASCPGRHLTSLRHCCCGSSHKNRASLPKQCFLFIHASFHTAQYKTTKLTTISSHCLAVFSAKDVCVQQSHAAKRRSFLPYYCYAIKTNDQTIRSQALQPASVGEIVNMSKLQAHHFMTPEQQTYLLCNVSCRQINCYCKN